MLVSRTHSGASDVHVDSSRIIEDDFEAAVREAEEDRCAAAAEDHEGAGHEGVGEGDVETELGGDPGTP
jgi:hypothetical protein